jgi:hypothetical protein
LADNFFHSCEFLSKELRDSYPYLVDEGWHQVVKLMLAAADEIERLRELATVLAAGTVD